MKNANREDNIFIANTKNAQQMNALAEIQTDTVTIVNEVLQIAPTNQNVSQFVTYNLNN